MKIQVFKLRYFTLLVFFFTGYLNLLSQNNAALKTFLQSTGLKYAGVGIQIVDVETGKSYCTYNERMGVTPASVMKLITTASAVDVLGGNYVFKTSVFTDGDIDSQGVLNGNIYIKGVGDPTLGSEYLGTDEKKFLKDWLDGIRKKGIKTVKGSVVVMDDLYGYEGVSVKWLWEDLGNYYATGTYGISVFDNTYRLVLKSGSKGSQPSVLRTEPEMDRFLSFENNLKVADNQQDSAYVYGIPFSKERRLFGTVPPNKPAFTIKGDIPDPGFFLAVCMTDYLKGNGVQVSGKPSTSRLNPVQVSGLKEIASTTSYPLKDIIRIINFKSNNHYAEHLFYALGSRYEGAVATDYMPGKAALAISDYWTKKGIDMKGVSMQDGSGLSPSNYITASVLTDILVYMYSKSKFSTDFMQSLPKAGEEGTVASLLKDTALSGKARVKSGSFTGVQAYSGYVDKGGKKYAFAIIVNNFTGSRATLKSQIGKFLVQF